LSAIARLPTAPELADFLRDIGEKSATLHIIINAPGKFIH